MELTPYQQTAIKAAYKAAEILRARFGNISNVHKKDAVEIVTEADTEAEKEIISIIHSRFPEHSILGEESGLNAGSEDFQWVIDPLDGTVNFAHQVPIFCVSIALVVRDEIALGVVLNPVDGQLYTAQRGQGAHLNGQPIRVSEVTAVADSLLVTGFPYHILELFEPVIIRYGNCLKASQAIRRLGSAALDLCYVACGRFEAFWEQGLKAWDTAAGALIAAEAGGNVTTFSNEPYNLGDHEILVNNGHVHAEMLELLKI